MKKKSNKNNALRTSKLLLGTITTLAASAAVATPLVIYLTSDKGTKKRNEQNPNLIEKNEKDVTQLINRLPDNQINGITPDPQKDIDDLGDDEIKNQIQDLIPGLDANKIKITRDKDAGAIDVTITKPDDTTKVIKLTGWKKSEDLENVLDVISLISELDNNNQTLGNTTYASLVKDKTSPNDIGFRNITNTHGTNINYSVDSANNDLGTLQVRASVSKGNVSQTITFTLVGYLKTNSLFLSDRHSWINEPDSYWSMTFPNPIIKYRKENGDVISEVVINKNNYNKIIHLNIPEEAKKISLETSGAKYSIRQKPLFNLNFFDGSKITKTPISISNYHKSNNDKDLYFEWDVN